MGFIAMVLLAGLIAAVATSRLSLLASVAHDLVEEEIREVHILRETMHQLSMMERTLERSILDQSQEALLATSRMENSIHELMTTYERLHPTPPPDLDQGVREFTSRYRALQHATADLLGLVQSGARVEAGALRGGMWKEHHRGVVESVNRLMDYEDRAAKQTADFIEATSRSTRTSILQLAVGGLVLSSAFAFWITASITRPISDLIEVTDRVAGGALRSQARVLREDEIGTLARRFNEMVSRLNGSFESQRRFYADASHELRIPLTIIRGEAEVALRDPETTAAEHRESLKTIVEVASQMTRLVDDLLFLSRSEEGQIQYESELVPLVPLLAEVIHQSQGLASLKDVEMRLDVDGDLVARGDRQRLRQLLLNLLDNAIKYTPPGGEISLALTADPSWTRVVISDTGIGISKDDLSKVFDRFYRVDAARLVSEWGTGLGLTIARSITKAHGGEIHVESAPGQGTRVSVLLPRASAQG